MFSRTSSASTTRLPELWPYSWLAVFREKLSSISGSSHFLQWFVDCPLTLSMPMQNMFFLVYQNLQNLGFTKFEICACSTLFLILLYCSSAHRPSKVWKLWSNQRFKSIGNPSSDLKPWSYVLWQFSTPCNWTFTSQVLCGWWLETTASSLQKV